MWWRVGIAALLLGHAFVHAVWRTYGPKTSWLLTNMEDAPLFSFGTALFVAAAIGFGVAGITVLLDSGWWRPLAVLSSVISLVLLVSFWNRGLVVGAAIDIVILMALWLRWPALSMVGP